MSIIPFRQLSLFSWDEIEDLGDLKRLQLALENLPDEQLMRELERERGPRGRDKNPVRAMWNSLIAEIVFEHPSTESMRRELSRNRDMRRLCGFDSCSAPGSSAYSRFRAKLMQRGERVREIFDCLVQEASEELEGFGESLAVDGKAVKSHARRRPKSDEPDGRRDTDADYGVKTYRKKDGSVTSKSWFGFKIHLLADTTYELPVSFSVTRASTAELPEARRLMAQVRHTHPRILQQCDVLAADRGYDAKEFIEELWADYGIKAIIDIRNMWQDGEEERLLGDWPNITYDYRGRVHCWCPETASKREMAFGGFEKDRNTLKYRCPVWQYKSLSCAGASACPVSSCIRIKRSEDPRVFTPVARSSYKWKTLYARRTAVERVNSRLDVSFGFERHFVRGLQKMNLKAGLAFSVMLAMALGHAREKRMDRLRSLVQPA
jgi:transposase